MKPKSSESKSLFGVIKSDSFTEKVLLLVLAAIVSGIAVPMIISSVERTRLHREVLSNAKVKLFDDVCDTVMTYESLVLDVSWFGTKTAKNADMQKKAFERYQERSVDLVAKWRIESIRAQTLASPKIAEKLIEFQNRMFITQDTPMNEMWKSCNTECAWEALHAQNETMLRESHQLMIELAADFGLTNQ
jgi:hypothetical protein